MACQICLRQFEVSEPVYRMQFGGAVYGGSRTSILRKVVYAFECSKYLSLGPGFNLARFAGGLSTISSAGLRRGSSVHWDAAGSLMLNEQSV
jgi:hypothetical protein